MENQNFIVHIGEPRKGHMNNLTPFVVSHKKENGDEITVDPIYFRNKEHFYKQLEIAFSTMFDYLEKNKS